MPISFRELFVTFALIGIFVFAGIAFIVKVQTDNDVGDTILKNEFINRTYINLETKLNDSRLQTQTQKQSFESEVPERGFGSLIIFAIIGVGQSFTGVVMGIYNVLIVLPAEVLNIPRVVIGVLTSIIIVSLVLLIWRVYRAGA